MLFCMVEQMPAFLLAEVSGGGYRNMEQPLKKYNID